MNHSWNEHSVIVFLRSVVPPLLETLGEREKCQKIKIEV